MKVEEKRECPSCGADSPVSAGFCWQCYTSFRPAAPVMPAGPIQGQTFASRPGMAPPAPMPAPAPIPSGSVSKIARLLIGAVAATAGYFGVQALFGGPTVELPATVGGSPRMTDAISQEFERSTLEEAENWDLDAKAGIYGNGLPEVFVVLIDGSAIESTDELFDSMLAGMTQAGASVNESDVLSGEHEGSEYKCVGVSGDGLQASACMWRADAHVGIVMDLTRGLDEIEPILFETHDASIS